MRAGDIIYEGVVVLGLLGFLVARGGVSGCGCEGDEPEARFVGASESDCPNAVELTKKESELIELKGELATCQAKMEEYGELYEECLAREVDRAVGVKRR